MNVNIEFDMDIVGKALLEILIEERDNPDELIEKLDGHIAHGNDTIATRWALDVLETAIKRGCELS